MPSCLIQALQAQGLRQGDSIVTLSPNRRPEAFLISTASHLMGMRVVWIGPMSSEDSHVYILADGVDPVRCDLVGFFEPFMLVRRPGWEWIDCAA